MKEWKVDLPKATQAPFPYTDAHVTFIKVNPSTGTIEQAKSPSEKKTMLETARNGEIILGAWPGRWSQDVFVLDDLTVARRAVGV